MASKKKKKETRGIWNLQAQQQFRIEQGRYKSNLKGGDLKCIAIGDGAVGKTSLLFTYALNEYPADSGYVPTVFDNHTKIHLYNGKPHAIKLWDTAGKEDYDRLRPLAYPHTDVFLVCFNLVCKTSFITLKEKWIPEIEYHAPGVPFLIIGCKDDLRKAQIWGNKDNINKLVHGYLRLNYKNKIPLDIFGVFEMYLIIEKEKEIEYEVITDIEAEQLCKELGGDKYLYCSSKELRGLNEIFDQVCVSWEQLESSWGQNSTENKDKNCVLL